MRRSLLLLLAVGCGPTPRAGEPGPVARARPAAAAGGEEATLAIGACIAPAVRAAEITAGSTPALAGMCLTIEAPPGLLARRAALAACRGSAPPPRGRVLLTLAGAAWTVRGVAERGVARCLSQVAAEASASHTVEPGTRCAIWFDPTEAPGLEPPGELVDCPDAGVSAVSRGRPAAP